jgi:hypothetical protein
MSIHTTVLTAALTAGGLTARIGSAMGMVLGGITTNVGHPITLGGVKILHKVKVCYNQQ